MEGVCLTMKPIIGNKYNFELKFPGDDSVTRIFGAYFMGVFAIERADSQLNNAPICCDCCGKALMKYPYVFRIPRGNASFEECSIACYECEILIGSSCMQKIKFTQSKQSQISYFQKG